jgi:hypothetical protein
MINGEKEERIWIINFVSIYKCLQTIVCVKHVYIGVIKPSNQKKSKSKILRINVSGL